VFSFTLKWPWHEIFHLWFCQQTPYGQLIHAKPFRIWLRIRHWHRCSSHSGVIDTAVHVTPLCISQRCQWHHFACHSGVHDTTVHVIAVSLTPLCY
jgi:hypothetical protein